MYYDEEEYFKAVAAYEEAEKESAKIIGEVFSFERGKLPLRHMTEEDLAIMGKKEKAWGKVLEIARRPLKP